jgi:superfamily I DNA and/or RNA helicase
MEAANVLLSTANSSELSRLVENGASFDEIIIEEAAKATGPELVAPMLLGMERLLIGDHRQLPAFDSDRLIALLEDVERVKAALQDCEDLIGAAFRDHGLDELLEVTRDGDRLASVCERARGAVRLFETLVTRDAERAQRHPRSPRLAVELAHQRRMHPVICEVVSEAFYERRLQSSPEAEAYFGRSARPFTHTSGLMPYAPVAWVDLPYVQDRAGAEEERPNFHNMAEREAVMAILRQVRAEGGKPPSLAVLSPYQRQAERLARAIEDERKVSLAHLGSFRSAVTAGLLAGTVDSFQGSEADLVIVSLVRNNGDDGARALGFLRDARRMNVLLSRARWQLVLVGSRGFFRAHARAYGKGSVAPPELGCIGTLMGIVDRLEKEQLPDGTPKFATIGASRLQGRRA